MEIYFLHIQSLKFLIKIGSADSENDVKKQLI